VKKLSLILIITLALSMFAGCVGRIPQTTIPTTTAPVTVPETTPPTTETVKICYHDWQPHPFRLTTADCLEAGEAFYLCTLCGEEKREPAEATGHTWIRERYIIGQCATGITYHERCKNCGGERDFTTKPGEHNIDWKNPGRVEAPTCDKDGFMYAYCKTCGEREMQTLPAAHTPGEDFKCVHCGADCPQPTEPSSPTTPTA